MQRCDICQQLPFHCKDRSQLTLRSARHRHHFHRRLRRKRVFLAKVRHRGFDVSVLRPFFSVCGGFVFNISYDNICSHQIRSYSTAQRGGSRWHIEDSMARDVPYHSFLNVWASFGPKIQTGFRTFLLAGLIWSEFGGGMTAGFDGGIII